MGNREGTVIGNVIRLQPCKLIDSDATAVGSALRCVFPVDANAGFADLLKAIDLADLEAAPASDTNVAASSSAPRYDSLHLLIKRTVIAAGGMHNA
jgi:hypothetical protein